ncbi:type II CAAX endopeptidase family protein [Brevundimonas sp.]|uniref:CPBP family intramembrane glutamic endopeptidase n=1 Tax=Brevundimonas sp. TaxID=1871086 RepID=UPI00286C711A|nr:type II CAAX endopeptidase family protein [Brevundimonas sp.]
MALSMLRSNTLRLARPSVSQVFLNDRNGLRNGWWLAIFLGVLAALLFGTILVSAQTGHEISVWEQAGLIAVATAVVQLLRRKPIAEVTGALNGRALRDVAVGLCAGFVLMAVPACLLWLSDIVRLDLASADLRSCLTATGMMLGVAVAEELLFRGVLFQRLVAGAGVWVAQLVVGAFFVLTHLQNPGMNGTTQLWAGLNIFIASLVFGQAYLRTGGLALPIAIHFMANVTQGILFGFGVTGYAEPSVLRPTFNLQADWLTGGDFGIEASLLGLIAITVLLVGLYIWNPKGEGTR